jgi:hypothetical protein
LATRRSGRLNAVVVTGARRQEPSAGNYGVHDGQQARAAEPRPLCRESDHRFDAPANRRRSTTDPALCNPTSGNFLGYEVMILRRNRGLAASPPVPYRLNVTEGLLFDVPRSWIRPRSAIYCRRHLPPVPNG